MYVILHECAFQASSCIIWIQTAMSVGEKKVASVDYEMISGQG